MYHCSYSYYKIGKYLSGQFTGWSKVTFNLTQIDEIQTVVGHTPALIGCDYAPGWATGTPPSQIDYSCNQYLKDYSDKHGTIQVENHFPNPVFSDGGGLKNKSDLVFTDLLKPDTETGKRWRLYIDTVAEGLNDLQQVNITALYRPFHEMNGGWFWWGQQVRQSFLLNVKIEIMNLCSAS
jgi:mannan endo-1,4-beta-mannosidase